MRRAAERRQAAEEARKAALIAKQAAKRGPEPPAADGPTELRHPLPRPRRPNHTYSSRAKPTPNHAADPDAGEIELSDSPSQLQAALLEPSEKDKRSAQAAARRQAAEEARKAQLLQKRQAKAEKRETPDADHEVMRPARTRATRAPTPQPDPEPPPALSSKG